MVIALSHAAIGNLLQKLSPGLLREVLGVLRNRHLLSHLLCDGQVLLQAKLQSFMVLMEVRKQGDVANTIAILHVACGVTYRN